MQMGLGLGLGLRPVRNSGPFTLLVLTKISGNIPEVAFSQSIFINISLDNDFFISPTLNKINVTISAKSFC